LGLNDSILLVTTIVCTYNSAKTIKRALDSVFSQDGLGHKFEIEVIVVDDNSGDNTLEIVKEYKVDIYRNEVNSGGPNKGRNLALKHAKGDYIAFIDHDDEWLPEKIEKQLEAIVSEKVVTCGYIDYDIKNNKRRIIQNNGSGEVIRYSTNETFLNKLKRSKNCQKTYFGSIMIHKELKDILFEEKFGMADYDWVLKIFQNTQSVEVTKPLFIRYVDDSNLSLKEEYRLKEFQISSNAIESYKSNYPQESTLGLKRLNGSMARYYYLIGNVAEARKYFCKANFSLINSMYFLTTFWGRGFVVKNFKVFG
jgi:glycosyltransferase involved in cell wall biosynthesis